MTHIFIGKHYPNIVTQFIIGCICYIVSFLIIRDIISIETYEQYKYYGLSLISIDTAYLVYVGKTENKKIEIPTIQQQKPTIDLTQKNTDITSTKSNGISTITLSSEINDYKVKLFDSEKLPQQNKHLSEEKTPKKSHNKISNELEISLADDSIFLASDNKNEISLSSLSKDNASDSKN